MSEKMINTFTVLISIAGFLILTGMAYQKLETHELRLTAMEQAIQDVAVMKNDITYIKDAVKEIKRKK